MIRIALCLLVATATSALLLTLRQQRLQLEYECNTVHARLHETQRTLWRQQVQIAVATAPAALQAVLARDAERPASNLPDLPRHPENPAPPTDRQPVLAGGSEWAGLFE